MTFGAFQGQLRPLVEAAWKAHAGLYGVSPSDRDEHETFYRTHLWVACRIKSTKEADERQRVALVSYFRDLAQAPAAAPARPNVARIPGIRIANWTESQQLAFFKLARTAFAAVYARDLPGSDQPIEAWLEATMQEAFSPHPIILPLTGDWLLGERTKGFDQAMGTLAVIAQDRYWMDRTAEGSEKRLRWQLDRFLADLSWLEGKTVNWSYVLGIHKQAHHGLPATVEEATVPQLLDILSMLDTQIRRLCKRFNIPPSWCPTRKAKGNTEESFVLQREWNHLHVPSPGHTRGPDGKLLQEKGVE